AGDLFDHIHQAVDGHQLVGAEVQRLLDVAVKDAIDAIQAIVDVHKASRLMAVAPDLDFAVPAQLGLDHLTANGRRGFFPPPVPRAVGTVDVVKTGDARRDAEI